MQFYFKWCEETTHFCRNMSLWSCWKSPCHVFTSLSCSLREKSSLPIFCKCGEPWAHNVVIFLFDLYLIDHQQFPAIIRNCTNVGTINLPTGIGKWIQLCSCYLLFYFDIFNQKMQFYILWSGEEVWIFTSKQVFSM